MDPQQHNLQMYTRTRNAISSLLVHQLKQVLREEGLTISGTKSILIDRVEKQLAQHFSNNNVSRLDRMTFSILQPHGSASTHSSPSYIPNQQNPPPSLGPPAAAAPTSTFGTPSTWHKFMPIQLNFKESPFYKHVATLSDVWTLRVVETGRLSQDFNCKLPPDSAAKFDRDAPGRGLYKIMLLGACDPASTFTKLDVAFPSQFEVRINGAEVRSNWKGLKNKPGSTRPADVTEYLRKTNGHDNSIAVTWALTNKKYYIRLDLVKQRSLEVMVRKLQDGKTISKEQVLRDMRNKAKDSDIVATSTVMSLKCPLSYTRLQDPCRGNLCNHNQCFDATSYLQLQQQAPTWLCPICNRVATYDNLQIDQYVADILASVSEDVEQVSITPEGEWSRINPGEDSHDNPSIKTREDSIEEIDDVPSSQNHRAFNSFGSARASADQSATPSRSHEPRSAFSSARNSTNKRSHDVVDLTLDSSEDDGPARKRMSLPAAKSSSSTFSSRLLGGTTPTRESPLLSARSLSTSQGNSLPFSRSFGSMRP